MNRSALAGAALAMGCASNGEPPPATYLSREELMDPVTCARCHQKHYDEWASSMHAYAADDPLFIAMNQRGQREDALGDFCVNCHAPMAVRTGATVDGLNLAELPQALKGVTCYFCHSVEGVDGTHNNPLLLADDGVLRGPFADPVPNAAHASRYSALHDRDQLDSSKLCGTCHDLVNTRGVHLERTYREWQDSVFSQPLVGTTCGQCHMDQSTTLEPVAQAPGVYARRQHSHRFPAVDLPVTPWPGAEELRQAVQSFLDTSLQSAVCVRGTGDNAQIQVVLDNVAAGHSWPSGAAQDRRAWVEVVAYQAGAPAYQSGVVPPGTSVTSLADPDLWLIRDCLLDEAGNEVHMFWQAAEYESNLLPGQKTFDPSDPAFYQTHVFQSYPRDGTSIGFYPERVTVRVQLSPFGLDIVDDLVASGDIVDREGLSVEELRARLAPLSVGATLEWTDAAVTERFIDRGLPVACVSRTNLSASADKVPAVNHQRCRP